MTAPVVHYLEGMRVKTATRIGQFTREEWDSLAGNRPTMSHAWLTMMEEVGNGFRSDYAIVCDENGPLAACAAPSVATGSGPLQRILARATILMSGAGVTDGDGIALRAGTPRPRTLARLVPVLRAMSRSKHRLFFGALNVEEADLADWVALGFHSVELDVGTDLRVPASYDAYLEQLRGADRQELRKMQRRAHRAGVTFHQATTFAAHDRDELYAMLCAVHARHGTGVADVPLHRAVFESIERHFAGRFVMLEGRVEGRLAGYTIAFIEGERLSLRFPGFHYALSRPHFVYFLLHDAAIRFCLERKLSRINGGSTMFEQKSRLGFGPARRYCCFRATVGPLDGVIRRSMPFIEKTVFERGAGDESLARVDAR